MIEVWPPRYKKPIIIRSEELQGEVVDSLIVSESQVPGFEEAAKGFITFLEDMHSIAGVDGVAFSLIDERHIPTTLFISTLAYLGKADERSAGVVNAVGKADAELSLKLNSLMPCAMGYYDSTYLDKNSFVRVLREKSRRSKTEKLGVAFLFRKEDERKLSLRGGSEATNEAISNDIKI